MRASFVWAVPLIVLATWLAGGTGLQNGFLNYDDPTVIVSNPRLDDPSFVDVVQVFGETRDDAYLPFYTLGLMPEASVTGKAPRGFHFMSLVWHSVNACGVFWLLLRLGQGAPVACCAALVFAVHPVAVESVAWASGRKDQVSLAGLLLGLLAYVRFLERGTRFHYVLAVVAFLVGSFAKGSVVVFPLLAAVLARWRFSDRRWWPSVVGLGAVAAIPIAVHLMAASSAGTAGVGSIHTPLQGVSLGFGALNRYLKSLLVPIDLSIHYHLPVGEFGFSQLTGVLAFLLLAGSAVWFFWRGSALAAAATWILFSLAPFNNVFPRTAIPAADRYLAVALPGFGLALTLVLRRTLGRWWPLAAGALLVTLGYGTHQRTQEFRDGETVFRSAMEHDPGDPVPPAQVAEALLQGLVKSADPKGDREEALELMGRSLGLAEKAQDEVRTIRARVRLGDTLLRLGRGEEAERQFRSVVATLALDPDRYRALGLEPEVVSHNLGQSVLAQGRTSEAMVLFEENLQRHPRYRPSELVIRGVEIAERFGHVALADGPDTRGRAEARAEEALVSLEALCRELAVDAPEIRRSLEPLALRQLGEATLAATWRRNNRGRALQIADDLVRRYPDNAGGYVLRAVVNEANLGESGTRSVMADLETAYRLDPEDSRIAVQLAGKLQGMGENRRSLALLELAHVVRPADPGVREALAALYLAQGRIHLRNGDRDKASILGSRAREVLPDGGAVWAFMGQVHEGMGRWVEAESAYARALELDPADSDARPGLARAYQARGLGILTALRSRVEAATPETRPQLEAELRDQAMASFRAALRTGGGSSDLSLARRFVREERERRGDPARELREKARVHIGGGEIDTGVALLRKALEVDGFDGEAAAVLADTLLRRSMDGEQSEAQRLQDRADAAAAARQALEVNPEDAHALFLACQLHYIAGNWAELAGVGQRFLEITAETSALSTQRETVGDLLRRSERR